MFLFHVRLRMGFVLEKGFMCERMVIFKPMYQDGKTQLTNWNGAIANHLARNKFVLNVKPIEKKYFLNAKSSVVQYENNSFHRRGHSSVVRAPDS